MRLTGGVAGVMYDYEFKPGVALSVEGGYKFLRKLTFAHDDDDLFDSDVEPSVYFALTFKYTFGESLVQSHWLGRLLKQAKP